MRHALEADTAVIIFVADQQHQSVSGVARSIQRMFHQRLADALHGLRRVDLEVNYRCPAPVLERAVRLIEHNCAIFQVAHGTPAACAAEVALFRDVLDADVERVTHIAAGDRCCTYRITPRR